MVLFSTSTTYLALVIALALLSVATIAFLILMLRARARARAVETRFRDVVDVEREIETLRSSAHTEITGRLAEASSTLQARAKEHKQISGEIEDIREKYRKSKVIYDGLLKQVAIFDERIAFAEMGLYEPHFDYTDSEDYKRRVEEVRELQKFMISSGTAVVCAIEWSVDGSKAKGKTLTNRNIRLTLRAFNSECDAAIANTRWNNANAMERRIVRAQEQIDKMNETNQIRIQGPFLDLKLKELRLTHEYREKLKREKEDRVEAARAAREEQKLLRDMEAAQEEEARYEKLLSKARAEAASISGHQLEAFQNQIQILERDLAEAHAKAERAQAMAERTRSGYVYIISNIGSFGSDVIKIGLTRRLDPADRVRELGDASVPFVFDTHAVIYSDDAPALERALHAEFEGGRINAQNLRKEFFKVSNLDDVESAVRRLAPSAAFFKDVEAQEYRETLSRRRDRLALEAASEGLVFPAEI